MNPGIEQQHQILEPIPTQNPKLELQPRIPNQSPILEPRHRISTDPGTEPWHGTQYKLLVLNPACNPSTKFYHQTLAQNSGMELQHRILIWTLALKILSDPNTESWTQLAEYH